MLGRKANQPANPKGFLDLFRIEDFIKEAYFVHLLLNIIWEKVIFKKSSCQILSQYDGINNASGFR